MPVIYAPGDKVKIYTIKKLLNSGYFANSYEAHSDSGQRIFLKQYINPTPDSGEEYRQFKSHQEKVKNILDTLEVVEKNYEYFEYDSCYFQAKEFMQGIDLHSKLFDKAHPPTDDERLFFATVFMYAIKCIHDEGIVHTDLKPQQVYLKNNPAIRLKYEVKVVDFDFCRLPGKSEPIQIATTPFYSSPEHLRSETPGFASDIFTCGIMLYQILGGADPHPATDEEQYIKDVMNYNVPKKLKDLNPYISDELSELIYKMLNPDKNQRPDAKTVHGALLEEINKLRSGAAAGVTSTEPDSGVGPTLMPTASGLPIRIEFQKAGILYPVSAHKNVTMGRDDFRAYGPEYGYLEKQQFEIIKTSSGWKIKGKPGTTNPTLLNGVDCTDKEVDLVDRAKIKVGNFEVTVKFVF